MLTDEKLCQSNSVRFDAYFERLIESGMSPCFSVVKAQHGGIAYRLICGKDTPGAEGRALAGNIRFNIASVTKPVTALLVMKLVETGELALSDCVKDFIPEYPFTDVNVFHLMTHTAGYDEFFIIPWPQNREGLGEFRSRIYSIDKLKYKTGETAAYWTFDYSILADIMERVTGITLEAFARETLFGPLQMNDSTFELSNLTCEQYFVPWHERENRFFPEACIPAATGDSGLYTTADDLIRIPQMLLNRGVWEGKNVFGEATADLMLRESTNGRFMKSPGLWIKGNSDAYGCFGDLNSPQAAGHTGMTGCMMLADPHYQTTAVILTNSIRLHEDWRNYKRICNVLMAM